MVCSKAMIVEFVPTDWISPRLYKHWTLSGDPSFSNISPVILSDETDYTSTLRICGAISVQPCIQAIWLEKRSRIYEY